MPLAFPNNTVPQSPVTTPGASPAQDVWPPNAGSSITTGGSSGGTIPTNPTGPLPSPTRIMFLGDSNLSGSNNDSTGNVGVGRRTTYQVLRLWRSDFDFIGTQIDTPEGCSSALYFHEGHPGFTIANINTNYPSYVANVLAGQPDIIVLSIGTNDVAGGRTLLQMQTDYTTLLTTITATSSQAYILHLGILPFVAGTTTGGNQAAWDAQRVAFNSWIQNTLVPTLGPLNAFMDTSSTFTGGDYQADGVHLNQTGLGRWGAQCALRLDRILGPRLQPSLPWTMRQLQAAFAAYAPSSVDGLTVTNGGFNPGSTSFAFSIDYYPTVLDVSALHTIVQYGPYGASGFWALYQQGNSIALYFDNASGTIVDGVPYTGMPCATALQLNRWHRITFMVDITTLTAAIYVNGVCVGMNTLPSWAGHFAAQQIAIGHGPNFSGAAGYYSRATAYQGTQIPRGGTMLGLQAVEADYYEGASLAPGTISAYYSLNNSLSVGMFNQPAMAFAGSATFVAAFPAGTPRRPWELGDVIANGPWAPVSVTPLATTGGTTTYANENAISDIIEVSGVLASNAIINLPNTPGKRRTIVNNTTGAFTLTVQCTGGSGFIVEAIADGYINNANAFKQLPPITTVTTITGNYTVLPTDAVLLVDTSAGPFNLTFSGGYAGSVNIFDIKGTFNSNPLTLVPTGTQKIAGLNISKPLTSQWGGWTAQGNGTDVFIK